MITIKRMWGIRHVRYFYLKWRVLVWAERWGRMGIGLGCPNPSDIEHLERIYLEGYGMSVPTIEELAKIAEQAYEHGRGGDSSPWERIVSAVLDALVPTWAEARCERNGELSIHPDDCDCEAFAQSMRQRITGDAT